MLPLLKKILRLIAAFSIALFLVIPISAYAQFNFLRLAPNTNWLVMVREPLQSCESWVREAFPYRYINISNRIFQMLFEVDHAIYQNQNSIGVRLEDLKENPKKNY